MLVSDSDTGTRLSCPPPPTPHTHTRLLGPTPMPCAPLLAQPPPLLPCPTLIVPDRRRMRLKWTAAAAR
jgi:hypothetical protein